MMLALLIIAYIARLPVSRSARVVIGSSFGILAIIPQSFELLGHAEIGAGKRVMIWPSQHQ